MNVEPRKRHHIGGRLIDLGAKLRAPHSSISRLLPNPPRLTKPGDSIRRELGNEPILRLVEPNPMSRRARHAGGPSTSGSACRPIRSAAASAAVSQILRASAHLYR